MSKEQPVNAIRFNKHPRRKNNDLVAAMYALYQTGKSLSEVGKVYGRTRQAVYDVFRTRQYPLRTKPLKDLTILDGHKFSRAHDGYLRGTVNGRRLDLHRYVWEKANGPVSPECVVWHKDRNKLNNVLENLEIIKKSEMHLRFNPQHLNQFTKPGGSRMTAKKKRKLITEEKWSRAQRYNVTS